MKLIQVTRGWFTMVDDEDFEELSQYEWYATQRKHVCRRTSHNTILLMHRYLMRKELAEDTDFEVDHCDRNPLNNQKSNLRVGFHQINCWNQSLSSKNTSGYKGVVWRKDTQKWMSRIKLNGRNINLGCFSDIKDAVSAYDAASLKYHGEFGCPNHFLKTNEHPSQLSP